MYEEKVRKFFISLLPKGGNGKKKAAPSLLFLASKGEDIP